MFTASPVRVKICGIMDRETALYAAGSGADALGFVFAESKRWISPEKAREIIACLPPFISKVGVFVNQSYDEIAGVAEYTGLDVIQLHGEESPEFCSAFRLKVIKCFSIGKKPSLNNAGLYKVSAYLLDTAVPGQRGGTGVSFDWRLAADFSAGPLIMAGGLTPENVGAAIKVASPFAVDVSSGVESGGKKDVNKIKEFVRRVKG